MNSANEVQEKPGAYKDGLRRKEHRTTQYRERNRHKNEQVLL